MSKVPRKGYTEEEPIAADDHPLTYSDPNGVLISVERREVVGLVHEDVMGTDGPPLLAAFGIVARYMEDTAGSASLEFEWQDRKYMVQAIPQP